MEDVNLEFTPDQIAQFARVTGIYFPKITSKRLFLNVAAKIALQTQSDTLLVSDSPDALRLMNAGGIAAVEEHHFIYTYALDDSQRRLLEEITGRDFAFVAILPDDCKVSYPETWEEVCFPFDVGQGLTIANPGQALASPTSQRQTVLIVADDFAGFGTGAHPTTKMCLELIEETLPAGAQVLDVGTGSGVLAIACAKLGATAVVASDVDEQAVQVTRKNIGINGVEEIVRAELGTLTDEGAPGAMQRYDLIIGNLFPLVLKPLFPEFLRRLNPGGRLIISGVSAGRERDVERAWQRASLTVVQRRQNGIWVAFVLE